MGKYLVAILILLGSSASLAFERKPEEVLRAFQDHFQALVRDKSGGKSLIVELHSEWDSESARPKIKPSEWIILFDGGLADRWKDNPDVLDLILCHELGHFLGGEPRSLIKVSKINGKKVRVFGFSMEGQADDYTARTCLKSLWANQDPIEPENEVLPREVIEKCLRANPEVIQAQICMRSNRAAYAYTSQLPGVTRPNFLTPSQERRSVTLDAHPSPQCRLDTFYAASVGASRPSCWFVPEPPLAQY